MTPTVASPQVSVIIPVFNDQAALATCLQALARQGYPHDRFDVIVVDNGSSPPLAPQDLPGLSIRWLSEATPGSYAARNHALRHAAGEVLAFTDADCLPASDWLERGVAALLADEGMGLVAGHVDLFPRDPRHPTGTELYDMTYLLRQADYVGKEHFGVTANLFTRRAVVDRVGPFNAALKSRGDYEWGRRVWAAGYRQAYCREAVVRHPARRTLRELAAKARRIQGGMVDLGELPADWPHLAYRWAKYLLPPRRILPTARQHSKSFGWRAGARFYGAFYWRRMVGMAEEMRLHFGGSSRR